MTLTRTCPPPTDWSDIHVGDRITFQTEHMFAEATGTVRAIMGEYLITDSGSQVLPSDYIRVITPQPPKETASMATKLTSYNHVSDEAKQDYVRQVAALIDQGMTVRDACNAAILNGLGDARQPSQHNYRNWRTRYNLPCAARTAHMQQVGRKGGLTAAGRSYSADDVQIIGTLPTEPPPAPSADEPHEPDTPHESHPSDPSDAPPDAEIVKRLYAKAVRYAASAVFARAQRDPLTSLHTHAMDVIEEDGWSRFAPADEPRPSDVVAVAQSLQRDKGIRFATCPGDSPAESTESTPSTSAPDPDHNTLERMQRFWAEDVPRARAVLARADKMLALLTEAE